jgi:two-component system LytT family sensor kinase
MPQPSPAARAPNESTSPGPVPRRTEALLFTLPWLVPAAIAVAQVVGTRPIDAPPITLGQAIVWQGSAWGLWIIWSWIIRAIAGRVPLVPGSLGRWFVTHATACAAVAFSGLTVITALDRAFLPSRQAIPFTEALGMTIGRHLDFQIIMYWAVLGTVYMLEFYRRYLESDREAVALRSELAEAQLRALRLQLNPHFLFNALNSVTELMDVDVARAQRMLGNVSELLRRSLRNAETREVPLWQELELIDLYLEIARARFDRALDVDVDVAPEALDLAVPPFVLQPIVENALRHGRPPGDATSVLRIAADVDADCLTLHVQDNGAGPDRAQQAGAAGFGIGLSNTRARLETLYGDAYRMTINGAPDGGCIVTLHLPLRRVDAIVQTPSRPLPAARVPA